VSRDGSLATFWALSDPTRLEILDRISAGSQTTVSQLAEILPITRQAVTRHVKTLEDAGLVVGTRDGRELRLAVDLTPVDAATEWLTSRAARWERTLDRLAAHLEAIDERD
jgi:DNA-binding transcriptional ArsR family regulator